MIAVTATVYVKSIAAADAALREFVEVSPRTSPYRTGINFSISEFDEETDE